MVKARNDHLLAFSFPIQINFQNLFKALDHKGERGGFSTRFTRELDLNGEDPDLDRRSPSL